MKIHKNMNGNFLCMITSGVFFVLSEEHVFRRKKLNFFFFKEFRHSRVKSNMKLLVSFMVHKDLILQGEGGRLSNL